MKKRQIKLFEDYVSKIGLGLLLSGITSLSRDPKVLITGSFIHCNRETCYNI